MTAETFCTTVVPGIAGAAYLFAGVANLCTRNYLMAVVWLCYSVANICLILVTRKRDRPRQLITKRPSPWSKTG